MKRNGSVSYIRLILLVFAITILFIGGLTYLFFRPHILLMFTVLEKLGLAEFFHQRPINPDSAIQVFAVYSLPNGLWLLSFMIIEGILLKKRKLFYVCVSIFAVGSLLFEILQKFGIIPGTFDFVDFAVILVSYVIGVVMYELMIARIKTENNF